MTEPNPDRPRRGPWPLLAYFAGMAMVIAFLFLPMYRITLISAEMEDQVIQSSGLHFLGEAWRIVTGSIQAGVPPLPLVPWWLVNAPVMVLVVVSTIPCAGLIWLAQRSTAAAWLGRIWWALLFAVGPFWYLWEGGPDESTHVVYDQLIGMNLMVFGTFLIAAAFWIARPTAWQGRTSPLRP